MRQRSRIRMPHWTWVFVILPAIMIVSVVVCAIISVALLIGEKHG